MDTKNTNKSCSGGENAAKASEGLMMKHRKTNKVFFTQSRSGPYGRFRWGNAPVWLSIYCWEKTGKKLSLKTEPDERTINQVLF